jgi:hypothetical protein
VTKSITLHPRNVQTPDMGDEDADAQGSDEGSESPSTPGEEI